MSREVRHDGKGALHVRFPFDRSLVDRIKGLPNRRWNAADRFWWVPDDDVVLLVDLLRSERFEFDEATIALYTSRGGAFAPRASSDGGGARRTPTLFDAPEHGAPDDDPRRDDYTVESLNARVRAAIDGAFPQAVWLVGEISGFNKNSHKRHVSFELVERGDDGRTVSRVSAVLFESSRKELRRALGKAGSPFEIEDEITVRVLARVELYVPWGQYRVVVDDLDIDFTLGEAARRREEIVRRLTAAGLAERNRSLPLPLLPLRVGLITSLGSDAYNDVIRTLQESGFAFRVVAHGARVQGHATEPSVLNALDRFRGSVDCLDVILICRGGGSRTDLVWFDSEPLGRAVATFPLPVIVGIGHEQDTSVLDAVGRSAKTPTAAARLLVDRLVELDERTEANGREILSSAARAIAAHERLNRERADRLARAARALLQHESTRVAHRQRRTALGARACLARSRERLRRWTGLVPRAATVRIERGRLLLQSATRSLALAARRARSEAADVLGARQARLSPAVRRVLEREAERTGARERRLQLVDPARVLERGYAILRRADGRPIREPGDAPAGTAVRARLRPGVLRLRSEGAEIRGDD
jgi:exodeoxyribonuclease VII large subunit